MARRTSWMLANIPPRNEDKFLDSLHRLYRYLLNGGFPGLVISDNHANIVTAHLEVLYTEYVQLERERNTAVCKVTKIISALDALREVIDDDL